MLNFILALLEALPILDKWFQKATIAYVQKQREQNNVDFFNAMAQAKREKNVENLRKRIGGKLDN